MNTSTPIPSPFPTQPTTMASPPGRAVLPTAATLAAPRRGLRLLLAPLAAAMALGTSPAAQAADPLVGAVIGAGAGAVVGQAIGGRNAALVGGAIGAVAGATVSSRGAVYRSAGPAVIVPGPVVTRVHYSGEQEYWNGPHPPPYRHGGVWRPHRDAWGGVYWVWEPAVVYPVAPVYPAPAYPVYGTPMPPYQPPIWVPPRHAPPAYRHPPPVYRPAPPVYRPAPVYGPPPVYRPAPGYGHAGPPAYRAPAAPVYGAPSGGHGHGNRYR